MDHVPEAIDAAQHPAVGRTSFVVGDVTDLLSAVLGPFEFFLDVGCFQGLSSKQRLAEARGVTALAAPGATVLMLAFQPSIVRAVVGGVSQSDVEEAFQGWTMLAVEAGETARLGWPMSRTAPQWYRLGCRTAFGFSNLIGRSWTVRSAASGTYPRRVP